MLCFMYTLSGCGLHIAFLWLGGAVWGLSLYCDRKAAGLRLAVHIREGGFQLLSVQPGGDNLLPTDDEIFDFQLVHAPAFHVHLDFR